MTLIIKISATKKLSFSVYVQDTELSTDISLLHFVYWPAMSFMFRLVEWTVSLSLAWSSMLVCNRNWENMWASDAELISQNHRVAGVGRDL